MLRVSDGNWSEDEILRITLADDTILMEDSSATNGDIFILNEDGGQIMQDDGTLLARQTVTSTDNLLNLVGQEITQAAVIDLSILPGGAYYGLGYSVINTATALVDSITSYSLTGQAVYQLNLSKDSVVGTFVTGHTVTATSNADPDTTLSGKLTSILTGYNLIDSSSSQYFSITDPLGVTSDNGNDGSVKIESLTSGDVNSIIVDDGGSGYINGDTVTVNNANTNGAFLEAQVAMINGGIAPEAGDLVGEWGIELETNTSGAPGDIELETATGVGLIKQEEAYDMLAVDHIVLEDRTVFTDGVIGNKISQESGTGNGDVTDIVVTKPGEGYTKTPLVTLPPKSLLVNDDYTITLQDATIDAPGEVILEDELGYIIQQDYNPGVFTVGETITGSESAATGTVLVNTISTEVFYTAVLGAFVLEETITGGSSGVTASIASIAGIDRASGTIYAKGTGIGQIRDVDILDAGVHYTSPM